MQTRWGPFTNMKAMESAPDFVVDTAKGVYVFDEHGRRYLDAHAGLWLVNAGYGRKEIVQAMAEQAERLAWFPSFGGMANRPSLDLAERLVEILQPEGMASVFFSNDGSEAVETALKLSRLYWKSKGQPRKTKLIGRHHAYHGVTYGALSVAGITANRTLFEPFVGDVYHAPAPYVSHCAFHGPTTGCTYACVAELERMIQFQDPDTVAAFIAEPVQAAGGVIIPPPDYLARVRDLCTRYHVLFIADEVVTAFGRLGTWTGSRYYGIQPDMMTFAKGLTSGYMPLGATAVSGDVFDTITSQAADGPEFRHGNTYSGHPVACAAAIANLEIIEKEDLATNAQHVGEWMGQELKVLSEAYPDAAQYPGCIGLLGRIEIVPGKADKPGQRALRVAQKMKERGVIVRTAQDILTLSPPLIMTKEQGQDIIDALRQALVEEMAQL
ncbi:aspartate aminotransferase family protein [Sulfobacillus sp. hq2]|uniref:aminotransferase family protein n=1 Tax=Sulfobacillus sp. hq2 TaxID=2039167 RepID=UPI000CD07F2C|nr:aspartate aminotransferase family protein [Sulfobacillus sp. hq2]POB10509.1 aspartate aminotransferase family protein [Sulfobacillus sp. hq2]